MVVIPYRCVGTNSQSRKNYHYSLQNILEECRSEVCMGIQAVVLSFIQHNQNLLFLMDHFNVISVTFVPRPQVYPKGNKCCLYGIITNENLCSTGYCMNYYFYTPGRTSSDSSL